MTNNEIQDIIDEHSNLISAMAHTAFKKLRQPTYWTKQDLIQEARCACVRAIQDYKPRKRTTMQCYIGTYILRALTNVVRHSWRAKRTEPHMCRITDAVSFTDHTIDEVIVNDLIASFTDKEKAYVQASIKGSSKIQIREDMGLTTREEKKLRKQVVQKILI